VLPLCCLVADCDNLLSYPRGLQAEDSRCTIAEPGCERFDVIRDAEEPNKFVFYEVYSSKEAIEAHCRTDHWQKWSAFEKSGGLTNISQTKHSILVQS
jgi:quinol monooxygenase YgiN